MAHKPFKMTTDPIVVQKNAPCQSCESTIANPTVRIKTITSTIILNTMRGVKFPLEKRKKTNKLQVKSRYIFKTITPNSQKYLTSPG